MAEKIKRATMTMFSEQNSADCQIRLDGNEVVISYQDPDGPVVYRGPEVAPGHYELRATNGGKATLHMLPGSSTLEGSWVEAGHTGMWSVDIEDE